MKKFTITRASIRPPAIDPPARVLLVPAAPGQPPTKVGYFHMQHFSANSAGDLSDALSLFDREKVKGIIMDLRGNPGGLYEQAQKVSDAFIKAGTLVSMVGVGGAQRKDETASDSGHEPTVPLAVLVNQNSASASEIVAGAVKNLDRGVVIGEGTFGKGSVQVLFDIQSPISFGDRSEDDKLGLKLTTAQYLTPGDLSIQGTGVIPDIETDPLLVQKEGERSWIRLQPSTHRRREADYEWHLEHPSARKGEKPMELLSYLLAPKPGDKARKSRDEDEPAAEDEEPAAEEEDRDLKTDFLIDFARDLLAQAKSPRRRDLVLGSKAYLEKVRAAEDKKVQQALEKQGVDWSLGPAAGGEPQLQLTLQSVSTEAKIAAGSLSKLRGVVKNVGRTPAYRVRAVLDSDNPIFDENEMVFGKIGPGESKSYELVVKVPQSSFTRTDQIKATLYTQLGSVKAPVTDLLVNIEGKPRPMFAYTYQTIDDQKGSNHDGQVQRGEQVRMLVTVKNIGKGKALRTEAVLRNGSGQEGVLISAGRFEAKDLGPDETKTFSFVYEVRPDFKGEDYSLELAVADTTLGEQLTDKIKVKVVQGGPAPEALTGTATITREDAPLREAAGDGGDGGRTRRQGFGVQDDGKAGGVHAARDRRHPVGLHRHRGSEGRRHREGDDQAGVAGDAAAADGDRADRRDGRHRAHQGERDRRSAGARRLRARLEPQREDPGEEGVLSAQPDGRRPHEDGLRGRHPAVGGQQPGAGVRARVERGAVAADDRRPEARVGCEPGGAADRGAAGVLGRHAAVPGREGPARREKVAPAPRS